MSHLCDEVCVSLKRLLRQGSKNGVWESILRDHDVRLVLAAQRCHDVEVRQIGNKKLLILNENGGAETSTATRIPASSPPLKKSEPASSPTPSHSIPSTSASSSRSPPRVKLRRIEVSWVDDANLFYVHDVEAVPNYLPQIEETLRYLKGAQTPLLESEQMVGAIGIVRCREVGFDEEDGWSRVEIRRVDSDGVLLFLMDHGNTVKISARRVSG